MGGQMGWISVNVVSMLKRLQPGGISAARASKVKSCTVVYQSMPSCSQSRNARDRVSFRCLNAGIQLEQLMVKPLASVNVYRSRNETHFFNASGGERNISQ